MPRVEISCWFIDMMFWDDDCPSLHLQHRLWGDEHNKTWLIVFRNLAKRVLNNDPMQKWWDIKSLKQEENWRIGEYKFYWSSNLLKFQFTMIDKSNIYSYAKDDYTMNMACHGLLK